MKIQFTERNRRTEKLNVQEKISKNEKALEKQWESEREGGEMR